MYRLSNSFSNRRLITALILIFIIAGQISTPSSSLFAFERKVLFEDFTSSTCPPCAAAAPHLEAALEQVDEDNIVAPIAFHVWWPNPGNDPWYLDNPSENQVRVGYYNINSAPTFKIDGVTYGGNRTEQAFADAIRSAARTSSPLMIDLQGSIVDGMLRVVVDVAAEQNLDGVKLYVALTEDYYAYVGTSGQRDHYDAMVKMIPNASGTRFDIQNDGSEHFEMEQSMEGLGWHDLELGNLILVAWVQNDNQTVYQAQNFYFPAVVIRDWEIADEANGDADGRAEAGETADLVVSVENGPERGALENVVMTVKTDDEQIQFTSNSFNIESIGGGEVISNADSPFQFEVADDFQPHKVTMIISVEDSEGDLITGTEITFTVGWPDFLVVDASGDEIASEAMMEFFDNGELPFVDRIDHAAEERISSEWLGNYVGVLWHSFNARGDVITEEEEAILMEFLDNGGTVVFSSVSFVRDRSESQLMNEYFGATLLNEDTAQRRVKGAPGDPHFDASNFYAGGDGRRGGAGNPSFAPSLELTENSRMVLERQNSGGSSYGAAAVSNRTEKFRTLLLSFPIESVEGYLATDERDALLNRIWDWHNNPSAISLDGDLTADRFSLLAAYPNPFNSQVVIPYTLEGSSQVRMSLFDLNGRKLTQLVNDVQSAGQHSFSLNAATLNLASGIYYVQLNADGSQAKQKVVYIR